MLLLFIFIFDSLYALAHTTSPNMCLDTAQFTSFNDWSRQWVPCPSSFAEKSLNKRHDTWFDITFHCQDISTDTCHKAKQAFERVGDLISKVILFKQPIKVNATLVSFCKLDDNNCDEKMITLGGSCPSRSIPLLNKDGRFRLHPQALVKQFELEETPLFAPFDIISVFNMDAPFWFEEDHEPIGSNQADFTFVILHEFMHGLGFYSGWNQYFPNQDIITPDPSPLLTNQLVQTLDPSSNAIHPTSFIESALDRLIYILPLNLPLSYLTHQINTINGMESPKFKSITTQFDKLVTTPFTLGIKTNDSTMILETALTPFKSGSSISHVASQKYTKHPEFLMRYKQDRGLTLTDVQGTHHAIGPFLLSVFEELGYATHQHPDVIPPLLTSNKKVNTSFVWYHQMVYDNQANRLSRDKVVALILCAMWCGLIF